ncbi:hypothetical protein M9H77_31734 [Catharanthus roseus]|uniref:Uncharacterized protein n=1 Tax=Catharanthus roseus TaxID=4058 RepID=A0ACC0A278_CATRO|nr:hypothetical protein M9H77_31734 [Catharanthus roseus]
MCPLYDGIMSGSCRTPGVGPIYYFPSVVNHLRLTNFSTLFACSISPPPLPLCPKGDIGTTFLSSTVYQKTYALRCHNNPCHIKVNLLLLLIKNYLIPMGLAAHQGTLEWDVNVCEWVMWHLNPIGNRWRGNRRLRCIKPMKHPTRRCGRYVRRAVPIPKPLEELVTVQS